MTNTPHTPSLWLDQNNEGGFMVWKALGASRQHIATFKRQTDANEYIESIALAPTLLAQRNELRELLTDVGQWLEAGLTRGQISRGTANRDGDLVTQIRAALAKANP